MACFEEIRRNICESTAVDILLIADKHGNKFLKEAAMTFIKTNISVILNTSSWKENMPQHGDLMDSVVRHIFL